MKKWICVILTLCCTLLLCGYSKSGKNADFRTEAAMQRTVIADENGVRITAAKMEYTGNAVELELEFENNSGKDLDFACGTLGYSCNAVNQVMVNNCYFNCEVANGQTATEKCSIDTYSLRMSGIREIAEIELGIYSTDDEYHTVYYNTAKILTSAADRFKTGENLYQTTSMAENVIKELGGKSLSFVKKEIFEQEGVKIISERFAENKDKEIVLILEVENTSDEIRIVEIGNVEQNGLVVSTGTTERSLILPKHRTLLTAASGNIRQELLPSFGIKTTESVGFEIGIGDQAGNVLAEPQHLTVMRNKKEGTFDAKGKTVYDKNGITIASKGIQVDSAKSDPAAHVLLAVTNKNTFDCKLSLLDNTLLVNGTSLAFPEYAYLPAGRTCAIDFKIEGWQLKGSEIAGTKAVRTVSFTAKLENSASHELLDGQVSVEISGKS